MWDNQLQGKVEVTLMKELKKALMADKKGRLSRSTL
jgi:hypothetical protein